MRVFNQHEPDLQVAILNLAMVNRAVDNGQQLGFNECFAKTHAVKIRRLPSILNLGSDELLALGRNQDHRRHRLHAEVVHPLLLVIALPGVDPDAHLVGQECFHLVPRPGVRLHLDARFSAVGQEFDEEQLALARGFRFRLVEGRFPLDSVLCGLRSFRAAA